MDKVFEVATQLDMGNINLIVSCPLLHGSLIIENFGSPVAFCLDSKKPKGYTQERSDNNNCTVWLLSPGTK